MNTKTTLIAIAALMMAACTQMENPSEERTPVALSYTNAQATETKAAQNLNEGTFATGETVKVRISNTGASSWTNYDFTTGSAGAMSPASTVPYYPSGSQNIDIVAYYPATAGTSFSIQTDQTADADYKASDLMFASVTNQAKQSEPVSLAFTHKLAKINVNITAGTGVTTINSVVSLLNVKPTVSFNQATGAVGSATGAATSIAMTNNGAACIPAQTIDGGLLSIVTNQGTATYTVSNKAFEAGKQYTLNITVSSRNVGTTNAITGWTSEGTVTVVAELPRIAGHEYVDMGTVTIDGLERNLKWATCNLGAFEPWEYGDYIQWGALLPNYLTEYSCWRDGKTAYDRDNSPFYDGSSYTKYNYTDGKTTFSGYSYYDDAARQRWGGTWRIPTIKEWTALFDTHLYTWVWQTDYLGSGKKGMLVTRNADTGPCSGNSFFLPAAGYWYQVALSDDGHYGHYWSSTRTDGHEDSADMVRFSNSGMSSNVYGRWNGLSIRPVSY